MRTDRRTVRAVRVHDPQDPTSERATAESRLRSLTASEERAPLLGRIPASFQEFRATAPTLDPGRPGLRILLLLAAAAVLVAGFFLWRSRPAPEPLPAPTPLSAPPSAGPPARPSQAAKVTVHVAGKVRDPGVYTLPAGARVTDAITAAGGARRGAPLETVNLARRLVDGEQIVLGGQVPPAAASPVSPLSPDTGVLDLNSATPDQLEQLPGVGEVLASRIADYRTAHGGFTSVDQLREVTGIGARRYEELKGKVRV